MAPPPLRELDSDGSVLFLGSGFSRSSRNIQGKNLPTGGELKEHFAKLLGVAPDDYDLPTLADAVNADPQVSLRDLLYETFTVAQLADGQKEVLGRPWMRIYTTNYDDSIELFYQRTGRKAPSFSYHDAKPRRLPNSTVIHLHGMIRNITDGNVLDQLILSEEAYVRQHFETSPWYDEFVRDLKVCSACYFVGYSLYKIVVEAVKRKSERRNQTTLRRLMRFSPLYQAFRNDVRRLERLTDLFELWRRHELISREPLFWLQYAILKTEANDLQLAEAFIETAYGRAHEIPGFRTYQIDTYALRLLLILETRAADAGPVRRFDMIIDKLEQVRPMIGDVNYRWHAVQVLAELEPFVALRTGSMSNGERIALVHQLRLLLQNMQLLPAEARVETGADKVERKVERSIATIVNANPGVR